MSTTKRASLLGLLALGLSIGGCSTTAPRIPYTEAEALSADVPGMPADVRFYADAPAFVFERFRQTVATQAQARHEPVTFLALSSGGADGAFGAGFMKGLTQSHQRPQFTMVSGISTGALMAPFVFLGSKYDGTLQKLYTDGYASALVKNVNILNAVVGNAFVDSDKLGKFIAQYIDQGILDAVAAEHRRGRRLLVVSTNLDQQRSVVWNMGAIAASGSPNALKLFRQVLAASASIPALFPPRLIDVESGGRSFQEMHVDGVALRQLYVAPDEVIYGGRAGTPNPIKDLYILVNNKIDPTFKVVDDDTVSVAARSLATVLRREGRNNVLSSFAYAQSHGIGYHIAFIDADVPEPPSSDAAEQFSTEYMTTLFARGEARGRQPSPWLTHPPLSTDPAGHALTAAQ
ncbi:patatin-like phospholipase family protein [Lichenibacterium dinghuense]|uniref:patatin-like phospholipase family protein n=1 Tax=Lichenibacterium dinghuense TaxID=2895977 RepID=UPI001F00E1A4|nr:patatin-like phospholipase family protein [Lichenibacterium sp. 6Y81]